jgi:hypothetical protein
MAKQKVTKESTKVPAKEAKKPRSSEALGVCEKAFSSESARLNDEDEPCEDGIQR